FTASICLLPSSSTMVPLELVIPYVCLGTSMASCVPVAVFGRRDARMLFKCDGEICGLRPAQLIGHGRNGYVPTKPFFGFFQSTRMEVMDKALPEMQEVHFAEPTLRGVQRLCDGGDAR